MTDDQLRQITDAIQEAASAISHDVTTSIEQMQKRIVAKLNDLEREIKRK